MEYLSFPPTGKSTSTPKALFFMHGNGSDIMQEQHSLRELVQLLENTNIHIFCVEYPGYASTQSIVQCTESLLLRQYPKSVEAVLCKHGLKWENTTLVGHSIGTGVVCNMALLFPIAHLVLMSAYTSIRDVLAARMGRILSLALLFNRFESIKRIPDISCPITLLHGKQDALIPYQHSIELARAATHHDRVKIVLLKNADHNNISWSQVYDYALKDKLTE